MEEGEMEGGRDGRREGGEGEMEGGRRGRVGGRKGEREEGMVRGRKGRRETSLSYHKHQIMIMVTFSLEEILHILFPIPI